jgi:hypothetical protein
MQEPAVLEPVELTDAELEIVAAGISDNFTTETKSGNGNPQGQGEGLVLVNNGGNAPPGLQ